MSAGVAPVGARSNRPQVDRWRQFLLLAALTGFVGSVLGLERPIVALIAVRQFHVTSYLAILGFVISFGTAKAVSNLVAGRLCDRYGRRRTLLAGWLLGVGEPVVIVLAPAWSWVVLANVLLGMQQGVCWTTLISMMIDRTRPPNRGFAAGVNEFAGYTGVALATFTAGYLAARFGLRPAPFLPSLLFIGAGLALTAILVDDTPAPRLAVSQVLPLDLLALPLSAVRDVRLLGCSQAGLIANLVDATVWGLLPLHFAHRGLPLNQIGLVAGAYPLSWGLGQLLTGPLSDRIGRRLPITLGMTGQGMTIITFLVTNTFPTWFVLAIVLGAFRALTYPTLIAAAADTAGDGLRASVLGVYRFYRDCGFVVGGVVGGIVADRGGIPAAVAVAGGLAICSAAVAFAMLRPTGLSDTVADIRPEGVAAQVGKPVHDGGGGRVEIRER